MKYLFCLLLAGCTVSVAPLKNNYSQGNFEALSSRSKDSVWDNIIDFFSKNGVSIKIIDRSSGLIVSGETKMTWTQENENGSLADNNAFIVVPKILWGSTPITPGIVVGEWNIRIKDAAEGKTAIAVNVVNLKRLDINSGTFVPFERVTPMSTGVFEQKIFEAIK